MSARCSTSSTSSDITENTIVVYTTDNGAEIALWPDGAMTMFHGEKGSTWEGGFRIPMLMRWPGVIKPGTVCNDIISLLDRFPTLVRGGRRAGHQGASSPKAPRSAGKKFKVHLDGYNFMPLLPGRATMRGRARRSSTSTRAAT